MCSIELRRTKDFIKAAMLFRSSKLPGSVWQKSFLLVYILQFTVAKTQQNPFGKVNWQSRPL